MKRSEIIRGVYLGTMLVCIALVVVACNNGNDCHENGCNVHGSSTNATVPVEAPRALTQVERLDAACRRLAFETKRGREDSTLHAIGDLCNEIGALPKEDALTLFDRWIEMAIAQPVTNANYSSRTKLSEKCFHIALFSFIASQNMRANSFDHWDNIFRFFSKYTNEITAVEARIKERGCQQYSPSYIYLHDLQVNVENWVYMTRTVFSNTLSKGLTEEQKTDILRRLDEVKKYTVPPPNSPFSKK